MSKLAYALELPPNFSLSKRELLELASYKFAKLGGTYHIYVDLGRLKSGEAQKLPLRDAMETVAEAANVYSYIAHGKPIYAKIANPSESKETNASFYVLSDAIENVSAHKYCKTKCGADCTTAKVAKPTKLPKPTKAAAKPKASGAVVVPKTKIITVNIPASHPLFSSAAAAAAASVALPAAAAAFAAIDAANSDVADEDYGDDPDDDAASDSSITSEDLQ